MTPSPAAPPASAEAPSAGATVNRDVLQTEFAFELPCGVPGPDGSIQRQGTMRMATARDEILPLRDPRVRDNEAYLTVLLLSRVITRIGEIRTITPATVEGLFTPDLTFLQDLYRTINAQRHTHMPVTCPACEREFTVDLAGGPPGES